MLFLGTNLSFAQDASLCDSIYRFVDQDPEFNGGAAAMSRWFLENLKYPENGIAPETGRIYFKLLIDSEGWLQEVSIENAPSWKDLDISNLKASAPQFSPGKISGKAVCREMRLPLNILLD